ncbi:unnamed protein product [Rotaria sp. Silwood1]|nr:unnamed protein product [Rotaria sp. Silwood1]CAF3340545.1 unnamed protein product [Rotaria sp. Silwood1]CAF3363557.1 unnamed protein product [Rotaria sp. Silwood1]CAF4841274.1 unnamed protein product [Rotaria sp. Silwood1]CAF4980502.1 unnamed protein product [Rotaria sp. Silwood1]
MCLCDLSANTDDQSGYLINVLKSLQKQIDINNGKLANFLYKYYSIKKFYDRLWKLFLKQIEEESSSQQQENDQKLLQIHFLYQTTNMKYLITYQERLIIAKYSQVYVLF